jgi:hypothetical protein
MTRERARGSRDPTGEPPISDQFLGQTNGFFGVAGPGTGAIMIVPRFRWSLASRGESCPFSSIIERSAGFWWMASAANDRFQSIGITGRGNRERLGSTPSGLGVFARRPNQSA